MLSHFVLSLRLFLLCRLNHRSAFQAHALRHTEAIGLVGEVEVRDLALHYCQIANMQVRKALGVGR